MSVPNRKARRAAASGRKAPAFRIDPERPVTSAARHFGVSTDYAYLIADGMRARYGLRSAWPDGHYWHRWAADEAIRVHGPEKALAFATAIFRFQQGLKP